jgi:hypothetical protein
VRIEAGSPHDTCNANYRDSQQIMQEQLPDTFAAGTRTYLLVHRHGHQVCKHSSPKYSLCPIPEPVPCLLSRPELGPNAQRVAEITPHSGGYPGCLDYPAAAHWRERRGSRDCPAVVGSLAHRGCPDDPAAPDYWARLGCLVCQAAPDCRVRQGYRGHRAALGCRVRPGWWA